MLLQRLYRNIKDTVSSAMSGQPSTTSTSPHETSTDNNSEISLVSTTPSSSSTTSTSVPSSSQPTPFVRPPASQTFDPAAVFMEAYDCAKLNNNWNKVSSSLMIHPEWLTKIPEGRRWTMLHQIVFSGNVMHLNEVLALQASNPDFRLLCKAADDKTVREVAADRAHIHPQMIRRIERLVAVDQLLNNAKERKWELVKQFITMQPDIVNEKPPYRRFYLAHHLACVGELDVFKDLSTVCHFRLDLLADNKTISQVARENNQLPFAEYIENLEANPPETAPDSTTDTVPHHATGTTHQYSPNFYDDAVISFIPANINVTTMFPPTSDELSYPGAHHHTFHNEHHHTSHNEHHHAFHNEHHHTSHNEHHHTSTSVEETDGNASHIHPQTSTATSVKPKPTAPQMTDDEQAAYEKTVINNIQKMSQENLLNSITCCITKAILHDPVVASDGFTYEREAIENWFKTSNRSPMTNQELENLELKPNYAIKSILQMLQGASPPKDKNPSFANEKPAYRHYYLFHHMVCAKAVEEYKRFKQITDCQFDLHLRADRKKCNVIACGREQLQFETFVENEYPGLLEADDDDDDDDNEYYTSSAETLQQTSVISSAMMEQKISL
ncbi:unnamed protein product [Adineta ricciae]|uniref:U-box domain-containing protein n=1 Tax=Adineta ricciae TaxID=249248 RepID=A0A814WI42_ADIRI|nr:unnamed protein product [Adineta ricciae]CAF1387407.1 unnamed protein product [Adineta ricciae]